MVQITKKTNGFLVEFDNRQLYLKKGTTLFPFNSLILVEDVSDIATFKRADTNDTYFSALISEINIGGTQATKQNLPDLFASNCCSAGSGGGGGADEALIPASADITGNSMSFYNNNDDFLFSASTTSITDDYYTKEEIDNSEMAIVSALTELNDEMLEKATIVELTQAEYDALSGDTDPDTIYVISDAYPVNMNNYYTKTQTNNLFNNYYTKTEVDEALEDIDLSDYYTKTETDTLLNAKVSTTDFETTERATSAALNDLNTRLLAVNAQIGDINTALTAINS